MSERYKAVLPTRDAYRAGIIYRFNGAPYGEVFDVPLSRVTPATSERNTGLLETIVGLDRECGYALVPKQYTRDEEEMRVTLTGGRSSAPNHQRTFPLRPKDFGWSQGEEVQDFYVELKGTGHGMKKDDSEDNKFDGNLYFSNLLLADRPFGGQNYDFARSSLNYCRKKRGNGIKIAPVFEVVTLPDEVMANIADDDILRYIIIKLKKEDYLYKGVFAQEKRLIPSSLRAHHFNLLNNHRKRKLIEILGSAGADIDLLAATLLQDARKYVENVALSTREHEQGYSWERIGHIQDPRTYETPKDLENSREALSRDLLIAPTGAYFADLESLEPDEVTAASDLKAYHRHYLSAVMGTFARVVTSIKNPEFNPEELNPSAFRNEGYAGRQSRGLFELADELERSELVRAARVGRRRVELTLEYPHIGRVETFRYSRDDFLPYVHRIRAKGLLEDKKEDDKASP